MATPDPTNVLFKIAHPDLYARNPFNLLNLPIDATAKDIRRRKEDIDAAFEAGTEEEEFKYVLPLDNYLENLRKGTFGKGGCTQRSCNPLGVFCQ